MSSPQDPKDPQPIPNDADENDRNPSSGPNLVVLYSLIAFALVAAIAIAMLIVFPFYVRR
jgi:hypothetical protein